MSTKPIDLIVANAMHEFVGKIALARKLVKAIGLKNVTAEIDAEACEQMARQLLCDIAHEASISKVHEALKIVGAPHSADDMMEGVRAAAESGA